MLIMDEQLTIKLLRRVDFIVGIVFRNDTTNIKITTGGNHFGIKAVFPI